jgi:hypothetical protein
MAMPYRGHIENGTVVLDEQVSIPEGTLVSVDVLAEAAEPPGKTLYERLEPFFGKAEGLPPDLAENHDHYLHGRPKK